MEKKKEHNSIAGLQINWNITFFNQPNLSFKGPIFYEIHFRNVFQQ